MIKSLFGDKAFYKRLFVLVIPIMVQNGITNFVNMLDNIMVGQVGTAQMTGVAVANQLIFVYNLCIFGAISGAGIFGAQFFGNNDHNGLRNTYRFKIIFGVSLTVCCSLLFYFYGEPLINLYLKGEGSKESAAAALIYAKKYLNIMLLGLLPYTVTQCYASTLRETGETVFPMISGIAAVVVNLMFNYVLIFGKLGAPKLGANGAAVATVISRFAELFVIAIWTHLKYNRNKFIIGAYKSLHVPKKLVKQIFIKGLPLMLNETLWAAGIAMINQAYSLKGLDVVAANNISQTFFNIFSVAFHSVGVAISIILGQILGSGDGEKAKDYAKKLITFSVIVSVIVGAFYALIAEFIPSAYNVTPEIKVLATRLMQISALTMPIEAFVNAAYFTLRSGGKTLITIIFDSFFVWIISMPLAFLLCIFTGLDILTIYFICQAVNIIKAVIGFVLIKKGIWIKNIVV